MEKENENPDGYVRDDDGVLKVNGARTFHVCRTGKKKQFYTLYVEAVNWGQFGYSHNVWFQQNLAHKLEDAMAKAEEFADHTRPFIWKGEHYVTVEYHDSPRVIKVVHEAFGVEMKVTRDGEKWWGYANTEFWDHWREKKEEVKAAGYWVYRTDTGQWLVFRRVLDIEKEYDDLSCLHGGEEE